MKFLNVLKENKIRLDEVTLRTIVANIEGNPNFNLNNVPSGPITLVPGDNSSYATDKDVDELINKSYLGPGKKETVRDQLKQFIAMRNKNYTSSSAAANFSSTLEKSNKFKKAYYGS